MLKYLFNENFPLAAARCATYFWTVLTFGIIKYTIICKLLVKSNA